MENPGSLREKNGNLIELKVPFNCEEVTAERYLGFSNLRQYLYSSIYLPRISSSILWFLMVHRTNSVDLHHCRQGCIQYMGWAIMC